MPTDPVYPEDPRPTPPSGDLYLGPDRGEFMVARLVTHDGVFTEVNCRIRKASVFNFASQYAYALVGYQIEYWPQNEPAPYNGGQANIYRPKDRPDYTTLYMRMKVSSVIKPLYLEDGIINDFITSKALLNPAFLENYTEAAAKQVASIAVPRRVKSTDVEYRNAFHVTRWESTPTTPLTITEQWMQYMANEFNMPADDTVRTIANKPFISLKDTITTLVADFQAQQ